MNLFRILSSKIHLHSIPFDSWSYNTADAGRFSDDALSLAQWPVTSMPALFEKQTINADSTEQGSRIIDRRFTDGDFSYAISRP
jgi:hypothetical protein